MKIALVSYEYPPDTAFGGIATYVKEVAHQLSQGGHQVEVFCGSPLREDFEETPNLRVNRVKVAEHDLFPAAIAPVFAKRARVTNFDVIESPEYGADGAFIRRAWPDLPMVVKLHTPTELIWELSRHNPNWLGWLRAHRSQMRVFLGALRRGRFPPPYRLRFPHIAPRSEVELAEKTFTQAADWVVSPSTSLREWGIRQWNLDPSRCEVVPNPYRPKPELLKLPSDSLCHCVGFFGRLEERKGISTLIETIPLVLARHPNVKFRFVGGSREGGPALEPYDRYLKKALARWAHALELPGPCKPDEIANEYAKFDICVFPSHWENFPNVCLEAMAAARGIVASPAGGMADMIEDGVHGLLAAPRQPQAWADAICRLLENPVERQAMGLRARERFTRVYAGAETMRLIEGSYRHAIDAKRSREKKLS